MPDPTDRIRGILAYPTGAWPAIEVATQAACEAGKDAIRNRPQASAPEQFAVALQAAIETLEGIGLRLAEGEAKGTTAE